MLKFLIKSDVLNVLFLWLFKEMENLKKSSKLLFKLVFQIPISNPEPITARIVSMTFVSADQKIYYRILLSCINQHPLSL